MPITFSVAAAAERRDPFATEGQVLEPLYLRAFETETDGQKVDVNANPDMLIILEGRKAKEVESCEAGT